MPPCPASGKMLNCAFGSLRASSNELNDGTITSSSPLTTRTGCWTVSSERLTRLLGPKTRRQCENEALAIAATLVGGMILARAVDDRELSGRILAACRARLNR